MKNKIWLDGIGNEATSLIESFIDDGGGKLPAAACRAISPWEAKKLSETVGSLESWDPETRLCVDILLQWAAISGDFGFLPNFIGRHENDVLALIAEMEPQPDHATLADAIFGHYRFDGTPARQPTEHAPFASSFANFAWSHADFSKHIPMRKGLASAVARWHPECLVGIFTHDPAKAEALLHQNLTSQIFSETDRLDDLVARQDEKSLLEGQPDLNSWSSGPSERCLAFYQLCELNELRKGKYHDLAMKLASMPEFASSERGVDLLLRHRPNVAMETIRAGIGHHTPWRFTDAHRQLCQKAMKDINGEGGSLLKAILLHGKFLYGLAKEAMGVMLHDPEHRDAEAIRKIFLDHAAALSGKKLADFWAQIAKQDRGFFRPEWQAMAKGKSKLMRETAASWLLAHQGDSEIERANAMLTSDKVEDRLGGAAILGSSGTQEDLARLAELHKSEPTKQVRVAIASLLSKHGIKVAPEPDKQVDEVADIAAFEESLLKRAKSIRLPKAPWLNMASLPPLISKAGPHLSTLAVTHIFQLQARGRGGEIVPEIEVLLPHLDRKKNAAFAHALLDQWFASDMKATTRWALDVAGITGDDSIIDRLIAPIPQWCERNNGSRGQWAVHSIALLGSETSLGTLDGLIQKYRTRRKYIGAAATEAISTTAKLLGVSDDELAERIVPNFGFGPDGRREFASKAGYATAMIDADFKIHWIDPETGQTTKYPTGNLTDEAAGELKEITKFLKEALKRQTARLENGMITARRWEIATWRNRFESHPIFRVFAMRLIWGVYDHAGMLIRTFRLYPNGLTATADGALEEFQDPATSIGLVHGLELDEKTIREWSAHLRRFKIKPLFKQLVRPVHQLDPLHENRKELQQTAGVKTTAGTLRSELMARGWSIGSTGDGGWIACMFRKFPAANIDVYLPVRGLHAASGKDDDVHLESAFFAQGATGKRSYLDRMGETETLAFGKIPPIIYSETLADLKAIT